MRANSGISIAMRSGSNTTTSPNVRGSTNHASWPSSRCITTWVCNGRAAPAAASSTWPLIRRWTISESPVSNGSTRYLPRRSAPSTTTSVRPAISSSREVRRTTRSRPTSTEVMRRPTRWRSSPRRTVSTSGSSGIGSFSRRRRATGRHRSPRPVLPPSSTARHPRRAARRRRAPAHGTASRGRVRATSRRRPVRRDPSGRSAPGGTSSDRTVRAVSRVGHARHDEAVDHRVGGVGATVEIDRPEHRLERIGENRRLVRAAGGGFTTSEQDVVRRDRSPRPPRRGRWR